MADATCCHTITDFSQAPKRKAVDQYRGTKKIQMTSQDAVWGSNFMTDTRIRGSGTIFLRTAINSAKSSEKRGSLIDLNIASSNA